MKISTKGRYAMRLMAELARSEEGGLKSIKEVSIRQEISEKYLEQIVRLLAKANLVVSVRGAQGGYRLARPSREITVGDVLRATEGDLSPVECVSDCGSCERKQICDTVYVWGRLREAIDGVVDGITLADVARAGGEGAAGDDGPVSVERGICQGDCAL